MILYHWQGHTPNFGDELNTLLWPRLLPGFFDDRPDARFLGIGSILDARHPRDQFKVVAGAGYAGYERKPLIDRTWIIHWVRGPMTATALGLPGTLGLGDPAMLLPLVLPCPAAQPTVIGFMPHFETLTRGPWHRAASMAGMALIDPRSPPESVVAAIGRCRLLLSESLHGAIVADAMRVPWVAIRPLAGIHRQKWRDWAETVDLTIRPQPLTPSSGSEWLGIGTLGRLHRVRGFIARHRHELDVLWPERLLAGAAEGLRRAAMAEPNLSTEPVLRRRQARMMEAVAVLRRQPMQGALMAGIIVRVGTDLHQPDNSAYQLRPVG